MAVRKIYPCVDVATSRSRLIDTGAVDAAHAAIAAPLGYEERFPPPRLSGRCGFRKPPFAG
jgi:hypothetical protein